LESFKKSKEKLVPRIETCKHSFTKMLGTKSRGETSTIGTANPSVRLPDQCQLNDKVTASFEPRHARQYGRISFEIGRTMGGSVATSK